MAILTRSIHWKESLDHKGRVIFQWDGREVLVEAAFQELQVLLMRVRSSEEKERVLLEITGELGRNVTFEFSVSSHVGMSTRQVFVRWFTQAVQAQAALARQRVSTPSFNLTDYA